MAKCKLMVELTVEDKQFKNTETGEVIDYKDISTLINGDEVKFSVKKDYKKLFDSLLKRVAKPVAEER